MPVCVCPDKGFSLQCEIESNWFNMQGQMVEYLLQPPGPGNSFPGAITLQTKQLR